MVTAQEYAALATRVYNRPATNRAPVPQGWTEILYRPDDGPGFSAGAYRRGNEIVISYTGTNEALVLDWLRGNIPLAFGIASHQAVGELAENWGQVHFSRAPQREGPRKPLDPAFARMTPGRARR